MRVLTKSAEKSNHVYEHIKKAIIRFAESVPLRIREL